MARCHDYRHANHITKTIHSSKVNVFLFSTTNLEGRYLLFQFLYNTTSLFQILKVINIRNPDPPWDSIYMINFDDTLCLHLGIYRGKHSLTKPWYICAVFILAEITEVNLSSITITIKSNGWQILKSMHKMPAFITEALALVVFAFFLFFFLSCS